MKRLKDINRIFSENLKIATVLFIILTVAVTYALFIYLQNNTETSIRQSLFEQQKLRQIESTQTLSGQIGSDLDSIMSKLQMLANSPTLQQGELSGNRTTSLLEKVYNQINSITLVDRLFILDKSDTATVSIAPRGEPTFVGVNFSYGDYIKETKSTHMPVFSNGFEGRDGKYRIAITYPIVSDNTGEYLGLVGASISTIPFFEHYGNIYDIESQYLAVLDRNSVQLIHPVESFIGTPFFGNITQQATGRNEILNNIIGTVMSGKPFYGAYEFRNTERLNTGSPIVVGQKPEYFVFLVTPTSTIYSEIDDIMSTQRIQTFLLLAGITTAVVILVLFLLNWNSALDREVKRRIREIDESNKQLSEANEQLKVHDKMQSEFINIAAHELRTPIQPILGLTNFLLSKKGNIESYKDLLNIVSRNAKRLQRLTEDILDVTRIESHSLKLNKEQFNLNDIIINCIDDVTINRYSNNGKNNGAVKILYEPRDIFVQADKERIAQVVSNLLHNAVKFTNEGGRGRRRGGEGEGSISVSSNRSTDKNEITVCVRDSGIGIDPEVLPKLFSKFVSKSSSGTGYTQYIHLEQTDFTTAACAGLVLGDESTDCSYENRCPEGRCLEFGFNDFMIFTVMKLKVDA